MSKQTAEEFVQEIRTNFNKHLDVFIKGDDALGKQDWDAFRKVYQSMTKEQLEALNLTEEQINAIIEDYGKNYKTNGE